MTVIEFGQHLEGYFGGKYTPLQMREVKRWAERRSPRERHLVYRYCVANETTQYKTPPDIKALNRNLAQVYEAYPELTAESYDRQIASDARQITDDAGWTEEEMQAALDEFRRITRETAEARRSGV